MAKYAKIIRAKTTSIYRNLAIENSLYLHTDFTNTDALLLWIDASSVVIGRNQNVWIECDVDYCRQKNIQIARRFSGGGSVYHDANNINISFLTHRTRINRQKNLMWLRDLLSTRLNIAVDIGRRDEIFLAGTQRKISGTAAKMASRKAYHHLTLLVDVDPTNMHKCLQASLPLDQVESNATKSVRSSIGSLREQQYNLRPNDIIDIICDSFAMQYQHVDRQDLDWDDAKSSLPNVAEYEVELNSWQWVIGWTPAFRVRTKSGRYILHIIKGVVRQITSPSCHEPTNLTGILNQPFDPAMINHQ